MRKRIIIIMFTFAILLFLVAGRVFYLQVFNGTYSGRELAQKALKFRSQYLSAEEYYRGEILDRNLLSLTDSGIRPTLVAFPGSIKNAAVTCKKLEEILEISAKESEVNICRSRENYGSRTPLILKVNLTSEEVKKYQEHKIPGIAIIPVKTRYGPNSLARHVVGYLNSISSERWREFTRAQKTVETNSFLATAYRLTDRIGVAGLEGKYEEVLKGSQPENRIIGFADAQGKLLEGLGYKIKKEEADAWRNHLILTLDRRCQEIVERVMEREIKRGAVVVIDIPSGDVLALASRPDFDQNNVEKHLAGVDELLDRTDRVAFYPGSVFKMVVAAGVLEENLVQPEENFTCLGTYTFSDHTAINCLCEHGEVNLGEAIKKSCNTTFIQLGLRLGNVRLAYYAARLGFTIKINHQSPPALLGNASIGQQGVLVSPLQIANLYATIGREGLYRPWHLVAQVRNYQGDVIQEFPHKIPVQVLKPSTCAFLKDALAAATREGTGQQAWLKGKGTAGKTGTAQANEAGKVIAWFAGFTPLENPRLAIVVMVEEQKHGSAGGLRGGDVAAPIFREIAERILK
ncbi:MAG: penicillin-binding transpeptidase domain-containing protein [Clostridia bacterium]|jgi:penicillin-binding protein 2|nr:penicillin-binding transpeptidase domain-containing protein [Clostridia bacterium]MDD4146025.1 penicillin-binding transpeptidase domain-containing protein [Clostridia bacterium]MDD4665610.1 penicillin-binding transpeptidase domain-containing protein [Clostridia bacterium]